MIIVFTPNAINRFILRHLATPQTHRRNMIYYDSHQFFEWTQKKFDLIKLLRGICTLHFFPQFLDQTFPFKFQWILFSREFGFSFFFSMECSMEKLHLVAVLEKLKVECLCNIEFNPVSVHCSIVCVLQYRYFDANTFSISFDSHLCVPTQQFTKFFPRTWMLSAVEKHKYLGQQLLAHQMHTVEKA